MATTVNLRKLLHRKASEFCTPSTVNTAAGSWVDADKSDIIPRHDLAFFIAGASSCFQYNADQDGWMQIPNSGIAGAFGAGACGDLHPVSMLGGASTTTATAGTTTTLTTARTIVKSPVDLKLRVVGGTGIGYEGTVTACQLGANSVLTVTPANAVAFDATTVFEIYGGSLWFMNAGTTAVGFSVYDILTNTWTAKSVTGLPTAWGTCGQLISTPGIQSTFDTGTALAGSTTTTLNTGKTYLLNVMANHQVRITAGTGIGQIRKIASNTAGANSVLTVGTAWAVTPDATSVFSIEGDSDAIYLFGNNAVTAYKYSISANTWATLAPTAARAGAMGAGGTADWIDQVPTWTSSTLNTNHYLTTVQKQNGRFIYSIRGGGSGALDLYDIALNTWISGVAYGGATETFTTGSCSVDVAGAVFLQKEATGRIFRFDVDRNVLEPYTTQNGYQSTTVEGDKMFVQSYKDGATTIRWLYTQSHSRTDLTRFLDI